MEQKRLIYLHRILKRIDSHWTNKVLMTLEEKNLGWSKSIKETLKDLNLPTDYSQIKTITARHWERLVKEKIEKQNTQRLINECYKNVGGIKTKKTKTASILDLISNDQYTRQPSHELLSCTKQETKTIMISRYRMLECGVNFKGTLREKCNTCNTLDDENHRLNECKKYREINFHDSNDKVPFETIYSRNIGDLKKITKRIECVWNTKTAHGTMTK